MHKFPSKRNELNKQIIECRSQLTNVCPSVLLRSIHAKIQALNSKLFHHLEQTEKNKLVNLTNSPKNRTEPLENQNQNHHTVVTIPENLPLSNAEKSVLSKGLNFVPISKKSDEFTTRQDLEKFLRRVQLCKKIYIGETGRRLADRCLLYTSDAADDMQ